MKKNPKNEQVRRKTRKATKKATGEAPAVEKEARAKPYTERPPEKEGVKPEPIEGEILEQDEEQERTRMGKQLFLEMLARTIGNIKEACKLTGIGRQTFYDWRHNDPEFRKRLAQVEAEIVEDVEGALGVMIRQLDGPSIRFFLQSRSDKYKPKSRLEIMGDKDDKTFEDVVDELAKALYLQRTGKEYADGRNNEGGEADADREQAEDTEQAQGDSAVPPEPSATSLLGQGQAPQPNTQG